MRGSAVGDLSRKEGEPMSVPVCVCVCPTGSRGCQTEEVSGNDEAEDVSVKKVSLMKREDLRSADL